MASEAAEADTVLMEDGDHQEEDQDQDQGQDEKGEKEGTTTEEEKKGGEVVQDGEDESKRSKSRISVKVQTDSSDNEIIFKIRPKTNMGKIMTAFYKKTKANPGCLRFLFDGARLSPEDTAESLGLENEDIIEVFQDQQGGGTLV